MAAMPRGPWILVSASAIGFYGNERGDELVTEETGRGAGFLADVVAAWEAAAGRPSMRACAWCRYGRGSSSPPGERASSSCALSSRSAWEDLSPGLAMGVVDRPRRFARRLRAGASPTTSWSAR